MIFGCPRQHLLCVILVAVLASRSAKAQREWPRCLPTQRAADSSLDQSRQGSTLLEITARADGCSLALAQGDGASGTAIRLASHAVIAGGEAGSAAAAHTHRCK
jgi:hypothetical protein